jgi:hypothetical protein
VALLQRLGQCLGKIE